MIKTSLTEPTTSLVSIICATTCGRPPAVTTDSKNDYQQSQGPLAFAIIDEVDNILIDEARTPLIISGPAHQNPARYAEANRIACALTKDVHFQVNEKDHTATLTDEGVRFAEKMAGVESFYTAGQHGMAAHDRQRAQSALVCTSWT